MRLIDADELIKGFRDNPMGLAIKKIIDTQPTAYDIDKVVEELEERKVFHKKLANYESVNGTRTEMNQHLKAIEVLDKSIEIVKQGLEEQK